MLGLSVWIVYLLDHLLDAASIRPSLTEKKNTFLARQLSNHAPRHYFVKRHRSLLLILLLAAFFFDLFIAWQLPSSIFLAGLVLGGIAFCYLCSNFFLALQGRWLHGREMVIALIFVGGSALIPLLQARYPFSLLIPMGFLAFLGILNCLLIARMERNAPLASLWPRPLPPPKWILGFSFFFLMLGKTSLSRSCLGITFWISLAGLAMVPAIAKKTDYEVASFAADGALILGAAVALL